MLAFDAIRSIGPGDLETHPLWHKLEEMDQYWARELGYTTSAELHDWLVMTSKIDDFEDEISDDDRELFLQWEGES